MTKTHQEISTANQKEGADAAESLAHYIGAPVPPPARTDGPWLIVFWRSDIAKKWLMALSGLALIGFVIVHMIGNLKLFIGKADINEYAEWLRTLGHPVLPDQVVLWIMRVGLLAAVVVHIAAAASLTITNRKARPVRYQSRRDYAAANFASRTMRWTGIIVLLFIIYHLLDLTWGVGNSSWRSGEVYDNIITSFQRWPVAIFYIIANMALAFHIFHGFSSMFASLGWSNPRLSVLQKNGAIGIAAIILIGNVSMPLLVVTGVYP